MIPYLLLILIPFLFQFIAIEKRKTYKLYIGHTSRVKDNNIALDMFFIILIIMLILRNESVGRDLKNYKYLFEKFSELSFKTIIEGENESIYALFNWFIGKVSNSYQFFVGIIAVITVVPIALLYREEKKYSYVKIILFVNLSTFVMLFSGIRQAWAISLGIVAYRMVRKHELWRYLLVCIIAIGIHRSAFMLLFMYPLYYVRFYKKHIPLIGLIVGTVFVFNQRIFAFLGKLLTTFTDYEVIITNTNAYGTLILFCLFLIMSYVITDENKLDRDTIGLRNFLLLAIIIQCFVPLHTLAMRMGYYYIIFIPITITKVLECKKQQYSQIAKIIEIVICVFFTFVFVRTTYLSYVTGVSALDTVPYIPFWVD